MHWKEVSKADNLPLVHKAAMELDVNERDERGRTPLMLFLTNRMPVQAIEILIEHGAELEAQDKLGETPLKKAVKFKQVDAILMLIEAGAELDSPLGILATAWNAARTDKKLADFSTCNKRSGSPFVDNGRAKLC
ncbi:ankyrin repeat domain-containing protein [Lysinibacillus sp. FSL M8-0337]|uniref:ankyrin repeat domain-containing protein n=1 Tax=Lysinibacillus TaxID=400634 RepID=UPI000AE504F1|nr:ankyrin repeat domain-containing protein [Lysinibacillus sphaericus]